MFEKLFTILKRVTAETTLEDLRQILADALDEATVVSDAVANVQNQLTDMMTERDNANAEIKRLQEANGRLFSERMADKLPPTSPSPEENDEEKIAKLIKELDY